MSNNEANASVKGIPVNHNVEEPLIHMESHNYEPATDIPTNLNESDHTQEEDQTSTNPYQDIPATINPLEPEALPATQNLQKSRYGRTIKPQ